MKSKRGRYKYVGLLQIRNRFDLNCIFDFFFLCTKAPQAAGRIHTDFEKGFIMAEVMKFDDFKELGSEAAAKVFITCLLLTNDIT